MQHATLAQAHAEKQVSILTRCLFLLFLLWIEDSFKVAEQQAVQQRLTVQRDGDIYYLWKEDTGLEESEKLVVLC